MSDYSSSDWPHWNALTSTFKESYSLTNESVFNAAGEIWPMAVKFARSRKVDESEAREEMLRAVARVSAQDPAGIANLLRYLFKTYTRRIERLLIKQKHFASLESVNQELVSDVTTAKAMQDHLLLAEIVAHMDEEMRKIHEGLILGYTFEEIGKELGKSSGRIASMRFWPAIHMKRRTTQPESQELECYAQEARLRTIRVTSNAK